MESIFTVLGMAWNFFSDITCPFLGISYASLFLGVLIVNFSVRLLRPLLGIGGSITRTGLNSAARNHKASNRRIERESRMKNKDRS